MKRSLFLFAVLSVLCIQFTWAQQKITITGVVKDSKGSALPGVSVSEKGTTNGTMTDGSGGYKLSANSAGTLVFSYIGYLKQEVPVGNGNVNVSLTEDQKGLQEVVVTALNIKRSTKALGYSMTEIKGSDVALSGQVNPVNSLQGKVAGVNITTGGGGPQSSSRILIRGNNSLTLNNQPLFVIDGVFLENAVTGGDQWGDSQDFGNMMKNLNPDDFESISVLKGGAATALYGSRGQNGVIIITTKKGFKRKGLGVSVTHSEMYDKAYKTLDFQNEFGVGIDETFAKNAAGENVPDEANWAGASFGPRMEGQMIRNWKGDLIPYTPQKNNVLGLYQLGKSYNTNVAIDGGNESTTFRMSYTNNNTSGITPKNEYKRNNFNFRATHKLSNRISLDASANYGRTNIENPAINGGNSNLLFSGIYKMSRSFNIDYARKDYIDPVNGGAYNDYDPYGMSATFSRLYKNNTTQNEDNFQGRLGLNVVLTNWLTLQLNGDVQSNVQEYERKELGVETAFRNGRYVLNSLSNRQRKLQALLTASRNITSDLHMDVSAGTESYRWGYGMSNNQSTDGGLKDPHAFYLSNSIKNPTVNSRIVKGVRTDAVYAFANFGWKDQLFLDLTGRNDWNSTLLYADGHGVNSYFYPSASLAWIFSESFKLPSFVTLGKLRASYAGTGGGTDAYKTSTGSYSFKSNYISSTGAQIPLFGYESNTLGNQDLKNEYTRNYEVGADIRFLNNRIGIDAAVYKKNTFNQIINITLPQESGITGQVINAGNVQNEGIEILLNTVPVRSKNFEWASTLSFTRNKNKIISLAPGVTSIELPGGPSQGGDVTVIARAGAEYGMMQTKYAYTYYQAKDASGNNIADKNNGKKILKGNYRYLRASDAGVPYTDMGSIQPKFLSSWTNSFRYKNFSMNVLLDAKVGGKYSSATYNYAYGLGQLKNTLKGRPGHGGLDVTDANGVVHHDGLIMDGVFQKGTTFKDPSGNTVDVGGLTPQEATDQGTIQPTRAYNNYFGIGASWGGGIRENAIFTSSWVAVREVTIGYNVPAALYAKLKLSTLRVNLVGRNLLYLYNSLPNGVNPEGLYNNSSASAADYGGVPFVRTMGFNIQASF